MRGNLTKPHWWTPTPASALQPVLSLVTHTHTRVYVCCLIYISELSVIKGGNDLFPVFRLPSCEEQGGSVLCSSQQGRLEQVPHGRKGGNPNFQGGKCCRLTSDTSLTLPPKWWWMTVSSDWLVVVSVVPADQSQPGVSGRPGVHQPMVWRPTSLQILL